MDEQILEFLAGGAHSSGELARALGISRQGVLQHLIRLEQIGLVRRTGLSRATRWERTIEHRFVWDLDRTLEEDELWRVVRSSVPELSELGAAAVAILNYAMTEIINNALEHSEGTEVAVHVRRRAERLIFEVADDGVGALTKVRAHFDLPSESEAAFHISKGRQTTAQTGHSGEGLFFTSKLFDRFALRCERHAWLVDNLLGDQAIAAGTGRPGTMVEMELDPSTSLRLRQVFDAYSDVETPGLQRSHIRIHLADSDGDFMSRSEARRIAQQLDQYEEVLLDFTGVSAIGQGFVDQLFRVWADQNPGTRLTPIAMNDDVEFMVRRGLSARAE
jgi:anti-sigma regulatory factor (Ser/Thr protein kinase)